MPNRATVRVSNSTGRDHWYLVSGWRGQACVGYFECETEREPLRKHFQVEATVGYSNDLKNLRIGVGIWDPPCGEACTDQPMGFISVPLSTIDPGST